MIHVRRAIACTWLAAILAAGLACTEANRGRPKEDAGPKPADLVADRPIPADQANAADKAGATLKPPDKEPDSPQALSLTALVKLVELGADDHVLRKRLHKEGIAFAVDDAALQQLKDAGASEAVLAQVAGLGKVGLDKPAPPAGKDSLTLMVKKWDGNENYLHSELAINGRTVGTFTTDAQQVVEPYFQKGWNTITIKTTAKDPAGNDNDLRFLFGRLQKAGGGENALAVLWKFPNGADWTLKDGKFMHRLGPDVKEVTLSFRVYYAGLEREGTAAKRGDIILQSSAPGFGFRRGTYVPDLTTTVFVNGTALNSYLGEHRQVVLTPLVKKGKNEVVVITHGVKNALEDDRMTFAVGGRAEWNVAEAKYEFKPLLTFDGWTGWERDGKTAQLVNKENPSVESTKRVLTFNFE